MLTKIPIAGTVRMISANVTDEFAHAVLYDERLPSRLGSLLCGVNPCCVASSLLLRSSRFHFPVWPRMVQPTPSGVQCSIHRAAVLSAQPSLSGTTPPEFTTSRPLTTPDTSRSPCCHLEITLRASLPRACRHSSVPAFMSPLAAPLRSALDSPS